MRRYSDGRALYAIWRRASTLVKSPHSRRLCMLSTLPSRSFYSPATTTSGSVPRLPTFSATASASATTTSPFGWAA